MMLTRERTALALAVAFASIAGLVLATALNLAAGLLLHAPNPVLHIAPERAAKDEADKSYERLLGASDRFGEEPNLLPTPELPRAHPPAEAHDCRDVAMDSLPHPIAPGDTPAVDRRTPPVDRRSPPCPPLRRPPADR